MFTWTIECIQRKTHCLPLFVVFATFRYLLFKNISKRLHTNKTCLCVQKLHQRSNGLTYGTWYVDNFMYLIKSVPINIEDFPFLVGLVMLYCTVPWMYRPTHITLFLQNWCCLHKMKIGSISIAPICPLHPETFWCITSTPLQ